MINVIEPGNVPEYECNCHHCKAHLSFHLQDTTMTAQGGAYGVYRKWYFIVCPECQQTSGVTRVIERAKEIEDKKNNPPPDPAIVDKPEMMPKIEDVLNTFYGKHSIFNRPKHFTSGSRFIFWLAIAGIVVLLIHQFYKLYTRWPQ